MLRVLIGSSLLALALAFALPAAAQTGNPAGTPPGTKAAAPGQPAPLQINSADRTFIEQLAIGNQAEIDFGQLADQKAHAQPVRDFGKRMAHDHGDAGRTLASLAKSNGIPLPTGVDTEHRELRGHLDKLNGASFDAAYMQAQVEDHQKTVQLLEYEIGSGQEQELRNFAADTLPIVRQHLEMAQGILGGGGLEAPQAAIRPATNPGVGDSASPQTPPAQHSPPLR
jgi:putative membrane protein